MLGLGNVAVDCARMLLQPPARLAATDVAGHALEQLAASAVRSVDLIGRRGPVQARIWLAAPLPALWVAATDMLQQSGQWRARNRPALHFVVRSMVGRSTASPTFIRVALPLRLQLYPHVHGK